MRISLCLTGHIPVTPLYMKLKSDFDNFIKIGIVPETGTCRKTLAYYGVQLLIEHLFLCGQHKYKLISDYLHSVISYL